MLHRKILHKNALFLGCLLGLSAGVSLAQSGDAEGGEGADVEVRRDADLSDAEMQAEAERIQARGTALARRMMQMLDESRQDRDIIRVTCLNAKLTETNATERSIEDRVEALRDATSSGDSSRRNHEFTVLSVLGQNLDRLEQEANQCVGSDVFETGSTRVETEIADNTPDEDISDIPDEQALPVPNIPPPASGTF